MTVPIGMSRIWAASGVAEVADVDEHDHVPEVVRHGRERRHDVVLREPLVDALLVDVRLARRLLEAVVEEVVALLERLQVAACAAACGRGRCSGW